MTIRFSPGSSPLDLGSLYEQLSVGSAAPAELQALADQLVQGGPSLFPGLPALGAPAFGVPLRQSSLGLLANMDPRAARQFSAQAVQFSSGAERAKLEAAIKNLFAELHAAGLPLEARPGSVLAEALATGDFTGLSEQDLLAVLVGLSLLKQNRQQMGQVAGRPHSPLAPRGSWNDRGVNSHGGGSVHTGPNRDAQAPTGPAPSRGDIPQTGAPGERLAQTAQNVAGSMGSVGYCYRGVKNAVRQATGVQLSGGSAYQAADQLAGSGRFREVSASPDQLRNLPAGAVVVWGRTSQSPHGHISVALGDGREASDHIQRQMTSLRGATNYRVFVPVA